MLKNMTAIGLALGLVLPGYAPLAQTTQMRTETQERAKKQEMLRKGTPAADSQDQVQQRTRTREEEQAREKSGDARQYQKRSGQAPDAAVSSDQTRDRTRDKDQDQLRDRDRVHNPAAGGSQSKGGGR
jgi:hypothetical protein